MTAGPEFRLWIDLGGSKIEFTAFRAAGRERLRRCVPTRRIDYPAPPGMFTVIPAAVAVPRGLWGVPGS
jgi:hypothetical protein